MKMAIFKLLKALEFKLNELKNNNTSCIFKFINNFRIRVIENRINELREELLIKKHMKHIKLFEEFITEKKETYDYGCAMIYFDFPEMKDIHTKINKDDVFVDPKDSTFGLETEPHCTLLYGLHADVSIESIKNALNGLEFGVCTIEKPSLFENDKFDVLKFDVEGLGLHDGNAALSKLPHTTDYPDYHPHMTVAYLKTGTGKSYIESLDSSKKELKAMYIIYSQPDGTKTKINL